jgi:hypothetical protein
MHKNEYKILDKIPVLRFLRREYIINTSDEFWEKIPKILKKSIKNNKIGQMNSREKRKTSDESRRLKEKWKKQLLRRIR